MAVEDKYADEMLSDEELEFVVGGTRAETWELLSAIYKGLYKTDLNGLFDMSAENYLGFKQVLESELGGFNLIAKADVGLNGTGEGEKANEYYTPRGNKITQEQLVNFFKNLKI
ncbi:MAG: hypothetical protein IJP68_09865 [Selenomonadaceae bacterium]|nr:hypothetical protein [Selenomonadaceae bacterium]